MQQLGRGLRLSEGKECLTVLDFIGQANKRYRFEEKFEALLSSSAKGIRAEIKNGFISLPKGCYIQLEPKAKEYIFDNINASLGRKAGIVARIESFEDESGLLLSLSNFLSYYHMDIRSIYTHATFSRLCAQAGVIYDFTEPDEDLLSKAFERLCTIDSRRWINFLLRILPDIDNVSEDNLEAIERRMLQMLQFTIWQKSAAECGFASTVDGLRQLKHNTRLFGELQEILRYQLDHIDFVDQASDLGAEYPLDLHCNYSRDQIMVALDYFKPSSIMEGVRYLSDKKMDLFFITLNKSDKDYSPTTMYKDYSINQWLFHWQSQNKTSEESPTGQRYIRHKEIGNRILLFVRESKKDAFGRTEAYTYLGTAEYVEHEGSRPMSITWKLNTPIPAKYLKKTNQLTM